MSQPRKRQEEPIRQSVRVDCLIEDAFRIFTEAFGEWWPLALYSVTGNEAKTCVMEPWRGGRVFERARSSEERDWGFVMAWDPPRHLKFTWAPGDACDQDQTVDVQFEEDADGTRVTLIHSGWETAGVAVCASHGNDAATWTAIVGRCFSEWIAAQMLTAV
jgi:hypothetical protein